MTKMNFLITSGKPKAAYTGQIISYKVNIAKGIQINWVTEITCVDFEKYFVIARSFSYSVIRKVLVQPRLLLLRTREL